MRGRADDAGPDEPDNPAEAAEEALIERLGKLRLSPEEYDIAADAAEFAVRQSRAAVERYQAHQRFLAEEEQDLDRVRGNGLPSWARQD
jgi:hypothetical protein